MYYCTFCKHKLAEYKIGWMCTNCERTYQTGDAVMGFVILESRPTPIGAAADTCPACKGSGKGRYPGQICCGTCDGDGQV